MDSGIDTNSLFPKNNDRKKKEREISIFSLYVANLCKLEFLAKKTCKEEKKEKIMTEKRKKEKEREISIFSLYVANLCKLEFLAKKTCKGKNSMVETNYFQIKGIKFYFPKK